MKATHPHPADLSGRMTIDVELQWSSTQRRGANDEDIAPRPKTPIDEAAMTGVQWGSWHSGGQGYAGAPLHRTSGGFGMAGEGVSPARSAVPAAGGASGPITSLCAGTA